ncbi:UNVERIFIED_CONTAM: hypothetical protein GTU68_020338 [Idotea baltica]|nr:hypothetical protein [Idotea baltica]
MTEQQSLIVKNLSKTYGDSKVVDSLSFSLNPGEILGLLGPNGAGKTTSVSMLYGSVKADSGSAFLSPSNQPSSSSIAMRSIGVVTQDNSLDPDFDVRTNLLLFGRYHGVPKKTLVKRVDKLIDQLELKEHQYYRIEKLSGGLQRRAVLARALIGDPQFIFLDEPTTGFDPDVRQAFWRDILALKEEGRSILLTTHYMDEAQRLCDRILLLQKGKVIDEGTPKELIRRWIGKNVVEVEGLSAETLAELFPESILLKFASGFVATVSAPGSKLYPILEQRGASKIFFRKATLDDVFLALQSGGLPKKNHSVEGR